MIFGYEILDQKKWKPIEDFWNFEQYQMRDGEALKHELLTIGFSSVQVVEIVTHVTVEIEVHLAMAWRLASQYIDAEKKEEFVTCAKHELLQKSPNGKTVTFAATALAIVCTK